MPLLAAQRAESSNVAKGNFGLDRALVTLDTESVHDVSRAEVDDDTAAVGRLVAAVDALIRRVEASGPPFGEFLADHPELI